MLFVTFAACLFAFIGLVHCDAEPKIDVDNGVLVLTNDNFEAAVKANEYILVEFYAPWCGHCKSLAPEYEKAAKQLESTGSTIKLGKIDATIEEALAQQFEIRGFPTLKFFKNGKFGKDDAKDYNGGRQADEIVAWVTKKSGPAATTVTTVEEAEALIKEHKVVIFGHFEDVESAAAKTFMSVAEGIDEHPFVITSSKDVHAKHEVDDSTIVLFKQFDEGKALFGGDHTSEEEIKRFLQAQSLPLIVEFNHESAQKIFGGDIKNHLLIFVSKEAGHVDKYVDQAKEIAKKFRNEMLFVTINTDEEDHKRILDFFGMEKEEIPSMRLIRLEENMAKYKPAVADLSAENIEKFVQSYLDGELKQHLLSQKLPEDWDKNPVKVLVAANFDEVVFDTEKDVLVEFYAPWCGHCKQLAPFYDELGKHYGDSNTVVIAKMDATINELSHTSISSFPTIKLYKKGDNTVVDYNGERTTDEFIKFIESGGEVKGVPDVEEVEVDQSEEVPQKDEL